MARKKFGYYTIDATKKVRNTKSKEYFGMREVNAYVSLTGDIEISMRYERGTWREDWYKDYVFGKKFDKSKIFNTSVINSMPLISDDGSPETLITHLKFIVED